MAKIENSHPKNSSGGYERLLGNKQIAKIFTKAHSTVITNGDDLEKLIIEKSRCINDLNRFIDDVKDNKLAKGSYLCTKKVLKESIYAMKGKEKHEPDFVVFIIDRDQQCKVIELKDGDQFDTKKSLSEFKSLQGFTDHISKQIPFVVNFYICCFNQNDKDKIITGFKKKFTKEQVMTGEELCNLLNIDYNSIVNERKQDIIDNFKYVIEQVTDVPEVREEVKKRNSEHIVETEFYDDEDFTLE